MNVGPTADGRIVPVFEERLQQMGECNNTLILQTFFLAIA